MFTHRAGHVGQYTDANLESEPELAPAPAPTLSVTTTLKTSTQQAQELVALRDELAA